MKTDSGNALFLILIAVALFAALSYAITQSGRGGGNIDKETLTLEVSSYLQDVANIRSGLQRMILLGTDADDIELCNMDSDFCGRGDGYSDYCTTGANCLFAPEGGGVPLPNVPGWGSSLNMYVQTPANGGSMDGIGTTDNDFIMFLENVPEAVCLEINRQLNLPSPIAEDATTLSGEYDFCYDGTSYRSMHALYPQ